jgi:hypothetical protein
MKTFLCLLVCAATAGAEIGYFAMRHAGKIAESADEQNPQPEAANPVKDSLAGPTPYPEITPDPSIIPPPN